AAGVLAELPRPQGARLEAADRVDPAREVALEEWQLVAVDAGVANAVRAGGSQRVREIAEGLRTQERVVPARPCLRLDESLAAEARDLHRQILRRPRGGVEVVVQRVAGDARRDAADQAGALGFPDVDGGVEPDVADRRPLDAVVGADPELLQRYPPQRLPAERGHRVGHLEAGSRTGAVEILEGQLPAERVDADGERGAPEVRFGEGEDDVAADGPDVDVRDQTLAPAEQVVLLDAHVEEQAVRRAEPRPGAEGAGLRLLHVHDDVHAVFRDGTLAGGDVDLLEEAHTLQRLPALAQLGGREQLLLLEPHLAPHDVVARLRVPRHLDAVDRDRFATLHLEGDVDHLLLGVDLGGRIDVGEREAAFGQPFGEPLNVVAQRARPQQRAGLG